MTTKTMLKRELATLTREQLIELIMNTYGLSSEVKQYYDFFVDPDVEKLLEKYKLAISKELSRTKYGRRSKARISVINKNLKQFRMLDPGSEWVIKLWVYMLQYAAATESAVYFSDTLYSGLMRSLVSLMDYADTNYQLDKVLAEMQKIIDSPITTETFERLMRRNIGNYEPKVDLRKKIKGE